MRIGRTGGLNHQLIATPVSSPVRCRERIGHLLKFYDREAASPNECESIQTRVRDSMCPLPSRAQEDQEFQSRELSVAL